jgi:hypothetical protein
LSRARQQGNDQEGQSDGVSEAGRSGRGPRGAPTTTTTSTTATTSNPTARFVNWKLTGSLTLARLKQSISLPSGSTFNAGVSIPGPLTGDIAVPPFTASINLLGLPTTVSTTFTEAAPLSGTIGVDPSGNGNLVVNVTSRVNIGVSGVSILGLKLPVSCQTSRPVVFPLTGSFPSLDFTTGVTFTGNTTLPPLRCTGTAGGLVAALLNLVMSGPNDPFTLAIAPPSS